MNDKPKRSNAWIIVLVILGLLLSCGIGLLLGGTTGYMIGRRAILARDTSRYEFRVEPERPTPLPRIPRMTPLPRLPDVREGAWIVAVVPDSPAERAGIRVGDVIVSVDDVPVGAGAGLADLLASYEPGDNVVFTVVRAMSEMAVTVELGRNPDSSANQAWLGIRYRSIVPED